MQQPPSQTALLGSGIGTWSSGLQLPAPCEEQSWRTGVTFSRYTQEALCPRWPVTCGRCRRLSAFLCDQDRQRADQRALHPPPRALLGAAIFTPAQAHGPVPRLPPQASSPPQVGAVYPLLSSGARSRREPLRFPPSPLPGLHDILLALPPYILCQSDLCYPQRPLPPASPQVTP